MIVLYNQALARLPDFVSLRAKIKSKCQFFFPLDEKEQPSSRIARQIKSKSKENLYVLGSKLVDVQTAVNEGGIGLFIAQGDEWEEIKVREMNSKNKVVFRSLNDAVNFILEKESF